MGKTVLFVTYGGGHARMITPVVRALQDRHDIKIVSLALTAAGPIFKQEGLSYLGFKDFLTDEDKDARQWGEKLAADFHNPASGITKEETIAYMGLSYQDLVTRYGADEAARLWKEQGRHIFKPLTLLERVMDRVQPDVVVTTNSPRSEQAAIEVANLRNIPTISMADLFGIHHFHPLESRYITVLSERTIDNMVAEGVTLPRERFLVTGNPAFDESFDHRGPIDMKWRKEHFPNIPDGKKALLWIDVPNYWNLQKRASHIRTDDEVVRDLDDLSSAVAEHDGVLLVRPHPAQDSAVHKKWMETAPSHVFYAGELPRHAVLNSVNVAATYTSAMGVETLLMGRRLIQLKYLPGESDMPLHEWNVAWRANSPDEISDCVQQAFYNDAAWEQMKRHIVTLLPQEKAAPKVAEHIYKIASAGQPMPLSGTC